MTEFLFNLFITRSRLNPLGITASLLKFTFLRSLKAPFTLLFTISVLLHAGYSFSQKMMAEGMVSQPYNFNTLSQEPVRSNHAMWTKLNDNEFLKHPEFGRLPQDAPCSNCVEVFSKRTANERYFVDIDNPKIFHKQTSYGDLHHWDGNFWVTIDHRLKKQAKHEYRSFFPANPITLYPDQGKVRMEQGNHALHFNDWKLFKKHQGSVQFLFAADWSNYTVGDDGLFVKNIFPGIDAEFIVNRGGIKSNFIVKNVEVLGAFDELVFRDHFSLASGEKTNTKAKSDQGSQEFIGGFYVQNASNERIAHYGEAVAYLKNQKSETNAHLVYRLTDEYVDLVVGASWLNSLLPLGEVVIDPIVTGTATLAQALITGSQYNASCNFINSCDHNLVVGVPANATLTNTTFSFSYLAQGICWLEDGAMRVALGSCVSPSQANFFWFCNQIGGGTCAGTNLPIFNDISSCLPAPSCAVQNVTFTLRFFRSCWGTAGCNNNCIGAAAPFSVTITGLTVEPANAINPISVSATTVCQGQSLNVSTSVQGGVSPYTYNWSFSPTGLPVIATGASTSITFPNSGLTTLYSIVSDNCGIQSVSSVNINVTPGTLPTFAAVGPFCSGTAVPALPTTSQNGISGTWSPAINNTATTTYTFTPNAGQCALPTTLVITINNCGYEAYATAVWVDDCTNQQFSDGQFYNITGSGPDQINPVPNNDFHNRYFGQFVQNSNEFWLRGAELKTSKNPASSNVCIPKLYYRVYLTAAAPGAFLPAGGWDINFRANCDLGTNTFAPFSAAACSMNGQQLWQCVSQPDCNAPVNLTQYPPGDYTLEVYFELPGSLTTTNLCNDVVLVNNNGSNYKATFTIIHPGQNGTLAICQGDVPTNAQLFNALNGNPTPGGTWTQSGNVYTYTVNPAPCTPASATVTVIPQNPPSAGTNGTLSLCQGLTPTPAQLFAVLGGNPNTGGTWSNVGNVYTYTVAPTAPCTNSATATVTVNFTPLTTPTFASVGPYCFGAAIPALPTTSQNGISGTWSPAINNNATTTYTFTPNPGQCAGTTTLVITVTPQPAMPALSCFQTATWNSTTCSWVVSGTQPPQPPVVNCWDVFVFNNATCAWENTGTPPNVPPMNLGPDQTICQGQTVTLTAPAGYSSYLWSNGATSQSINVSQVGNYSVTGTVIIPTTTNLVTNPGFNSGNTGFTTSYTVGTGGPWGLVSNGNTYAIVTSPHLAHNHLTNCPYQGNMLVANGGNLGNNANVWCQAITVTPNTNYIFSVDAINPHNNAGWGVLPLTLNLMINGNNVGSLTPPMSPNNCNWQTYSSSVWNSGSSTSVTICIQNATTTASLLAIDNISFSPVLTCTYSDEITINVVQPTTPTFAQVGPFCSGATIPALPTTSQNNITGTWSPAIINTSTTTYTFTPTPGQCSSTATMTITITPNVTPTFAQVGPFCAGATIPALPTSSQNNITGTWSPAINNATTTTYTFTPTAGQCATTTTMVITVNPNITPTFAQVGPFCAGATIPALPTTSQNNITGTWSPAINNTTTTTYAYTPTAGQCATTTTMVITVNPNGTPTFAQVGPFCSGATIPPLPTTSQNNIIGTWSPAINNTATTTYTFTPAAGQCATPTTMNITIDVNITPTFAQVGPFCSGASIPALPTTSQNSITGTWSPAINNTSTTTYTFTPTAGQCATTTTMVITINPNITPSFAQVGPFCSGATTPALPTTSQNSITGTWSPAINNTATTTYTFTPTAGQCATTTTMVITINPNITPTFAQVGPFCSGATIPALPTTSQNSITGTWSPAINNTATTTYTFTPTAGQCATIATMVITINPNITPTFAQVGPFCSGAIIPALPTTSQNSITGMWSPAINNTATTTYTFTPTAGQCATTSTMTITVDDNILPTFAQVGPFCSGAGIPALPTTSQNNISGTWSPAINNTTTTTYTFTPNAGQCATTTTMLITVNPNITPTFAQVGPYCSGSNIPALPTTSQNNITGTWSPAINNSATTIYTFTPAPGLCATTTTTTIAITVTQVQMTCPPPQTITCNINNFPAYANLNAFLNAGGTATSIGGTIVPGSFSMLSQSTPSGPCPQVVTRTYIVSDDCGNSATCTQQITITDDVSPTGTAPANLNLQCITQVPNPNINSVTNVSDNCSTPVVTHLNDVSNNQTCPQIITRTYRITDACGNFTDVVQTITINDNTPPSGNAPANVNVQCAGAIPPPNVNGLIGVSDNCSTPVVTHLSDVSNNQTCPQIITRTYRITDACGNFTDVAQTITVNDNTPPTGSAPANITVLCANAVPAPNVNNVTNVSDNCSTPVVAFVSDVSNGNVCNQEVITRTYSITDLCGNQTLVTQNITISAVTPNATLSSTNPSTCQGSDGQILISGLLPNQSVTIVVNNQSTNHLANAQGQVILGGLTQGNYTIDQITPLSCPTCTQILNQTLTLSDPPNPEVNAGQDFNICEGESITVTAFNPNNANVSWSGGVTDGVAFTPPVGNNVYTVTAELLNCISTDQVVVNVNPLPVVNPGPMQSICNGNTVVLNASGALIYEWSNGVENGVPFQQNEPTVVYSVIGTTAAGCKDTAYVLVNIFENPVPQIALSQNSACGVPATVQFTATSAVQPVICYWNFGDGLVSGECDNVSHTYTEPGCFDVLFNVTYGNGCQNTVTMTEAICITEGPTAAFVMNPEQANAGDPIQFINLSQNATNYRWDLGVNAGFVNQTNVNFSYENPGVYDIVLVAIDELGCTDTARMEIQIEDGLVMYVPNSFTPDGDFYNNTFKPILTAGFDPYNYELLIFNRWGEILFESKNSLVGWDGTYGGKMCPEGTYVWQIRVKNGNGTFEMHRGFVNLLK